MVIGLKNGNTSANYVCQKIEKSNGEIIKNCLKSSTDGSTLTTNKTILGKPRNAGEIICNTYNNNEVICELDNEPIKAYSNGTVIIGTTNSNCTADNRGNSICYQPSVM